MNRANAMVTRAVLCRYSAVLALLALLLCGCTSPQGSLEGNFPPGLASKARSDFATDITYWDVSATEPVPKRVSLVFYAEPGVKSAVRNFCEQKLITSLNARGFEIDPGEQAELMVCIVKASDVRKPVRSAKVRIAARVRNNEGAGSVLVGIADGIVTRPDLSWGVSMPKASYFRAAQFALSKLTHQLDSLPQSQSPWR